MGDYVTLTCPTCGASLNASADASRLVCASCGNAHLLRPNGEIAVEARDSLPDPAERARPDRVRSEIDALEEEIHALAVTLLQREYRQAAGALVPLGKLTLRELKALLATEDPAEPARLIAALTIDELPVYAEQYQGSPIVMSRRRRAGVEDIARLIALRLQVEARRRSNV
ncbi:MAG: hypothetical protein ACYCYF_02710 [Anaerolineae bacterium]